MKVYGLTGGIASGKSTVSAQLAARGLPVIDADLLAREVLEQGQPALKELADVFPEVINSDGSLDRQALGARIFNDAAARAALNAITHPRIRALAQERTAALARQGFSAAIYDAPLLIENRLHLPASSPELSSAVSSAGKARRSSVQLGERVGLDGVIVVWCEPHQQLARLQTRNQLSAEQAQARLAAQLPLEQKRALATWVIDNSGTPANTSLQVENLAKELLRH